MLLSNEVESRISETHDLVKISLDATIFCIELIKNKHFDLAVSLIKGIRSSIEYCLKSASIVIKVMESIYYEALLKNAANIIIEVEISLNVNINNCLNKIEFILVPIIQELREEIYFWGIIYKSKEKMNRYYQEEYILSHQNKYLKEAINTGIYEEELTISILAFNKLDYTKQCVDSVLKYSKGLKFELVLIDNGSSDKTKDYFESISYENKKIISLKYNIGAVLASNIASRIYKSKYIIGVSNDVIVTHNAIQNLLYCIKSSDEIDFVVPISTNVSNYQSLEINCNTVEQMHDFAEQYNVSNRNLWYERHRLMPVMSCYKSKIFSEGLFLDRLFQFTEFCDDDWSLRMREYGYKLILAKDTFVYHHGSVTLGEHQINNNTLTKSRQIFYEKHKFDAWQGIGLEFYLESSIDFNLNKEVNILCIEPGLSSIPYLLKNKFKENGNLDIKIHTFSRDEIFKKSLDNSFANNTYSCNSNKLIKNSNINFDYIILCNYLNYINDYENLINNISDIMLDNTIFIFTIHNYYSLNNLIKFINEEDSLFNFGGMNSILPVKSIINMLENKNLMATDIKMYSEIITEKNKEQYKELINLQNMAKSRTMRSDADNVSFICKKNNRKLLYIMEGLIV